jgi:hypothetical protein
MADRDRLRKALQANAEGKYDGAEVLGALSGQPRADIIARFEAIKEQSKRTDACPLHELLPTGATHKRWRCRSCGWEPEAGPLLAYEQGLKHGREHPSGGGRG